MGDGLVHLAAVDFAIRKVTVTERHAAHVQAVHDQRLPQRRDRLALLRLVPLVLQLLQGLQAIGQPLVDELADLVTKHARSQGYTFAGPVSVTIRRDEALSTGTLQVDSSTAQGSVSWRGVLDIAGQRHPLVKARTVIGRGSDADITLADSGTSRRHVEVLWDGERAMVRDLGSTNGTLLNGRKITESPLPPDSTITIGRTDMIFRVVAQASAPARPAASDATRAFDVFDGGGRA